MSAIVVSHMVLKRQARPFGLHSRFVRNTLELIILRSCRCPYVSLKLPDSFCKFAGGQVVLSRQPCLFFATHGCSDIFYSGRPAILLESFILFHMG
jgi:hypothetical protein